MIRKSRVITILLIAGSIGVILGIFYSINVRSQYKQTRLSSDADGNVNLGLSKLFEKSNTIVEPSPDTVKCAELDYRLMEANQTLRELSRNLESCFLSNDQAHRDMNVLEERIVEQEKIIESLKREHTNFAGLVPTKNGDTSKSGQRIWTTQIDKAETQLPHRRDS